jgi:Family of unknown function (DUF6512)
VERRLAIAAGVVIVVAGTLLHFVYGWSGQNALAGLVSPVNESVWEHTKLLVVLVVAVGAVEAVLLHDVRRVAWAALVEAVLGALAIVAVFTPTPGLWGKAMKLWGCPWWQVGGWGVGGVVLVVVPKCSGQGLGEGDGSGQ